LKGYKEKAELLNPQIKFTRHGSQLRNVNVAGMNLKPMSDITQMLQAMRSGDGRASEELLPLVYHELRQLAAAPRF
jgi:hypothetical protein